MTVYVLYNTIHLQMHHRPGRPKLHRDTGLGSIHTPLAINTRNQYSRSKLLFALEECHMSPLFFIIIIPLAIFLDALHV